MKARVMEMEAGDPSYSLLPAPHPSILLRFHSGSATQGGERSSLLVAVLFWALSFLHDHLSQGLVPGHFPGKGTGLVAD